MSSEVCSVPELTTHDSGSVVRRIRVSSVELRRPSIIRALVTPLSIRVMDLVTTPHALPDRQDTSPTLQEQTLAQSFRSDGGLSVYTGMNDKGDYFVGNRRLSSTTGKGDIYNTPVPTVTGEDVRSVDRDTSVDIVETSAAETSQVLSRSVVVKQQLRIGVRWSSGSEQEGHIYI